MQVLSWWRITAVSIHAVFIYSVFVQASLVWVNKPQNRAVTLGDDLVLQCQARLANQSNTSVTVSYKWTFNEGNLSSKASRFFNNSLFVSRMSESELGNYSCIVTLFQQADDGHASSAVDSLVGTAIVIEAYIDPFLIHPVSFEGSLGQVVVLTCITGKSAPSLQVQWLKDKEIFTEGENMTASFGDHDTTGLSVQFSMKLTFQISTKTLGCFECVAFNNVLKKEVRSQQANITKKFIASDDKPQIEWNLPKSLIVAEREPVILPCVVIESTEPITITWYSGQYRVDQSKRVYVLSNSSLGFLPVGPKDSGNYSCRAENSKGITQSPYVELIVAYLEVSFRTDPSDSYAIYGQDVILKCNPPDSIPPATVMWYKDYLPLDPGSGHVSVTGNNLNLTSVMKSDNGLYYCVAFNNITVPSSRTSRVARLVVEGPPIMVQPPINTKVTKGKLLHLICLIEADPAPNTTWQFEGWALPVNSKVSYVNRGQELWITNIGKEWEGRFTCLSRNKFGYTSADALVTVIVPPSSLKPIGELIVRSGDSLLIPCNVVCDPMPTIQWFYNGMMVSVENSLASVSSLNWTFKYPDLYLKHVQPQHAGKYSCVGYNEAGNASSSGQLVVHVPPVIKQAPSDITAVIGDSVTLNCLAEGIPAPVYNWLHNFTAQLPKNSHLGENNSTIDVYSLGWDSTGIYTCQAQNLAGTVQASSIVKVMVPPTIEEVHIPETPVRIQTRLTFSCTASGIPTPVVQWVRFDKPIQPDLNGRVRIPEMGVLIVDYAWKNDSGQYECWASSDLGQVKRVVSLVVYGQPSPPVLLRAVPLSSESVYLIWGWPDDGDQKDIVDNFQITFWEKTSVVTSIYHVTPLKNETRIEILGLQPNTEYMFCVLAVNDAGVGPASNILSAVTFHSKPSPPVNLQTSSLNASSVTLTWEVPTSPNGVVRMYQLRYRRIGDIQQDFTYVNITEPQFPSNDFTLSPLVPYSEYEAQVRACNIDRGQQLWGDYSSVTFHTQASKPSLPPQMIKVDPVDPYSLRATWQQTPLLAKNGPVLFYHISFSNNESQQFGRAKLNSSITSYTKNGLSPWRYYSVTLTAENEAGLGPSSDPQGAMTLPIAPVAIPDQFHASATSSSSLTLYWKALPREAVTCNISAYLVEYRKQGSSSWFNVTVPYNSSSSFSYVIDSLLPWTWYESQVAAFCHDLTSGMGPFTDVVLARTFQGVSSLVTMFSYVVDSTHISLSWQPPKDVRGDLIGYRVVYEALDNVSDSGALSVNTTSTMTMLQGLSPDTVYNISLAAVNGAGLGQELIVRIQTLSLPSITTLPTSSDFTTNSSNNTQHLLGQNNNSYITKNLASIVAGSIVGAVALIIMTVFVCLKCIKYRQKQRLNYDVDSDTVGIEGTSYRTLAPSSDIVISSHKPFHSNESQYSAAVTQSPDISHSALDEGARSGEHVDSRISKKGTQEKRRLSKISFPILSMTPSPYSTLQEESGSAPRYTHGELTGVDNPGFIVVLEPAEQDQSRQAEPNPWPQPDKLYLSVSSDDAVSVSSDSLRRSRMRSENAAAIAVLRTSQTNFPDDTEGLMDFESIGTEVIFNERTVL